MADHKTSDLIDGVEIESGDLMHVARGSASVRVILGTMAGQDSDTVEITGGTALLDIGTTASQKGKPALDIMLDTTLVGNSGSSTAEQDLLSLVFDANALSVANNEINIHAYGAKAINTNIVTIRAYANATLIGVVASSNNNTALEVWEATIKITSLGTAVQQIFSKMERDDPTFANLSIRRIIAGTLDDTAPITIKFTAQVADGGSGIHTADGIQDYSKGSFSNG